MVALLRGINVGGNRKVPMPGLRALAEKAGLGETRTYINSGNLVFEAGRLEAGRVEALLERAVAKELGFHVDVVVRTASQWKRYAAGNPFPGTAETRPGFLQLGISKRPCARTLPGILAGKATFGEKVRIVGDAIWIDFPEGVGKSKLTPALLDRAAGSPVTLRNWNTVLKLGEMLSEG